jgi:2-iminoacetate synthase
MAMVSVERASFVNESEISQAMGQGGAGDPGRVRDILAKARELHGLNLSEVAALSAVADPALMEEVFATARWVKEEIYGRRLVFFAPLYISNLCRNECLYCAFRRSNKAVKRRVLTQEEIARETRALINQGHKRVLVVAGESYPGNSFQYVLDSIATVYSVKEGNGEIRRLNANIAPLAEDEFRLLKEAGIGTFQLFQETYHRDTYARVHRSGPKTDFDWRATGMDRAMRAGIDDVGVGVLFGLFDWRFEILALMQHIRHLEQTFGVGCHTISVPRLEPAVGSDMATSPPCPVADADFKKIVAVLRLAVPYTGLIMSTRESAPMRRETYALGVSQISAGSRTNPGGYEEDEEFESSQFQLGDHRPLPEVIRDISDMGYIPSFCTACYRLGRTGQDFMDLAKPGLIKEKCAPNALSTFEEYLLDYAPAEVREAGEAAIDRELSDMPPRIARVSEAMLDKVRAGKRDVFC